MNSEKEEYKKFEKYFMKVIDNKKNNFHPLVWINGNPEIEENVHIGFFSEVNAKGSEVKIGKDCDIASFVAINAADSHERCIELSEEIERKPITIENNVFIGSHCFIGGGTHIGHHSVIGAGVILKNKTIPPYSLVTIEEIKEGYYKDKFIGDKE